MDAMQMQGSRRLEFNDAGTYIHSYGDGTLDLVSDGTSDADAINIESTSGITLDAGDATYGITYEDDGTLMLFSNHLYLMQILFLRRMVILR